MSAVLPSIAAMPYAVTSLRPLMRRCAPGSMRLSQRGAAARNQANDRRARAGSALEAFHIERVLLQALVGGRDQPISAISASTRAYFQLPDAVIVFSAESLHDVRRELAIDFPKVSQRCFIRFQPRRPFFHICQPIIHHSKAADHRGQTQALEHERRENHAKGDEQNVVTSRERAAVRKHQRHRERSCERHNAADPCPGNNRHVLPGRIRIAFAQGSAYQTQHVGRCKDPSDAHNNGGAAYQRAVPKKLFERATGE